MLYVLWNTIRDSHFSHVASWIFLWLEHAELCFFSPSRMKLSQFWKTASCCHLSVSDIGNNIGNTWLIDLLALKFQHLSWAMLVSSLWHSLCLCWVHLYTAGVVVWKSVSAHGDCHRAQAIGTFQSTGSLRDLLMKPHGCITVTAWCCCSQLWKGFYPCVYPKLDQKWWVLEKWLLIIHLEHICTCCAPVLGVFIVNSSGLRPLFPLSLCGF